MTINIKPQNKGKLHAALGIAKDTSIPAGKLNKAVKSSNPTLKKEAVFAKNARGFNHVRGGNKASISTDRGSFKI